MPTQKYGASRRCKKSSTVVYGVTKIKQIFHNILKVLKHCKKHKATFSLHEGFYFH